MQEELINLFLDLVNIESQSKKERDVANYIKNYLYNLDKNIDIYEDDVKKKLGSETGNLIINIDGNTEGPSLLFLAHMDTVGPTKNIKAVRKDGAIFSDGTTILGGDDKIGVAAILYAIKELLRNKTKHPKIQVLFTVCEEVGLLGAKYIDKKLLSADFAFALDSSSKPGIITVAAPTQNEFTIEFKGKTSHAGVCPEKGINAIQMAADAIHQMPLGRIDSETTMNVGEINGGIATNIISDLVVAKGEIRSLSMEKLEFETKKLIEILEKIENKYKGRIVYDIKNLYANINIDPKHPVVTLASKASDELGFRTALEKSGGGSDANILNGYGIPTVNLGTGMQKVHTTEEFVLEKDIFDSYKWVLEIIKQAVV